MLQNCTSYFALVQGVWVAIDPLLKVINLIARVAQSVERKALNLVVGGSSPPSGDINFILPFAVLEEFVLWSGRLPGLVTNN